MQDLEIIELYWNKDENAIKQSQIKYGNYCYTIANNILFNNEDVQEVLNDTYLGAWNAIPPARPNNLATYLGKITRHLAINKYREKNAKKRGGGKTILSFEELAECIPDNQTINVKLNEQYLAEYINTFLAKSKAIDRKLFVCRYWYNDSIEDIASRFNFSESKVKMNLKRTRDRLKEYLIKQGVII